MKCSLHLSSCQLSLCAFFEGEREREFESRVETDAAENGATVKFRKPGKSLSIIQEQLHKIRCTSRGCPTVELKFLWMCWFWGWGPFPVHAVYIWLHWLLMQVQCKTHSVRECNGVVCLLFARLQCVGCLWTLHIMFPDSWLPGNISISGGREIQISVVRIILVLFRVNSLDYNISKQAVGGGKEFTNISIHHRDNKYACCLANTFKTKILAVSAVEFVLKFAGSATTVDWWTEIVFFITCIWTITENIIGGGFSEELQQICLLWAY